MRAGSLLVAGPTTLAAQVYAVAQRHEGGLGDGIDLGRIGGEDGLDHCRR